MNKSIFALRVGLIALGLAARLPDVCAQGLLVPSGPPGPTFKTLQEVEPRTPITSVPFTITAPGSYYVISNLTMTGGTNGITVLANDVTIDLRGFTLNGNGVAASGIVAPGTQTNLVIQNGVVKNWKGAAGIDTFAVLNVRVERVQATDNGAGIRAGAGALVRECTASGNADLGIRVWDNSIVASSVARLNGSYGIGANNGSTVSGCTAAGNRFYGITVGPGTTVVDCSSQANQGDGIGAVGLSSILHCTVSQNATNGITGIGRATIQSCTVGDNGGDGITVTFRAVIEACTVSDNGGYGITTGGGSVIKDTLARNNAGLGGIRALDGSTVSGCTSRANGGTNTADGIWAGSGSTVTACACTENTGNGIIAGFGCTISGNTARGNRLDGIRFNSSCGVTGNTCDFNGNGGDGAGIHALGQAARIEGNHSVANDRGIDVDGDRNVIIRNTCGFNTVDYDIVVNNKVGIIFPALNSSSITGSDGRGSTAIGTTDPWANLSY